MKNLLRKLQSCFPKQRKSSGGILPLVFSVLFFLMLSLSLIWLNLERTKLAYKLQILRTELDRHMELKGKLLVERDYLLSPQQLGFKAKSLGLHIAKPGQIRRMTVSVPEVESW